MQTFNLKPEECLVIEDSERGLIAAQAAGCQSIWIKTEINEAFTTQTPYLEKLTHAELFAL